MHQQEAIQFYTKKRDRSRSVDSRLAYYNILDILEREKTMNDAWVRVGALRGGTESKARRAIYNKALREMNI